jgi:hypothetical protein
MAIYSDTEETVNSIDCRLVVDIKEMSLTNKLYDYGVKITLYRNRACDAVETTSINAETCRQTVNRGFELLIRNITKQYQKGLDVHSNKNVGENKIDQSKIDQSFASLKAEKESILDFLTSQRDSVLDSLTN